MLYLDIPNEQKLAIAKNGFYYDEMNEKFICFSCNFATHNKERDNLLKRHFIHYTGTFKCLWLEGLIPNIRPDRKSIIKGLPDVFDYAYYNRIVDQNEIINFDIENALIERNIDNYQNEIYLNYISDPVFIPMNGRSVDVYPAEKYYIALRSEKLRISTYRVENHEFPLDRHNSNIVERLAKLGFFYTLTGCNIECAFCHIVFGDAKKLLNFDIETFHNDIIKKYPFMVCTKTQNIPFIVVDIPSHIFEKRNDYQEINRTVMCKVCFNADINIVHSCGHISLCEPCSKVCANCIICNKSLIEGRKVYFT